MGGSVTWGFLRGKRTVAQFSNRCSVGLGRRYSGLNTLRSGSIPLVSALEGIFYVGQELSVKPLACLVPTAPTAHGGSKGRPAGDE